MHDSHYTFDKYDYRQCKMKQNKRSTQILLICHFPMYSSFVLDPEFRLLFEPDL